MTTHRAPRPPKVAPSRSAFFDPAKRRCGFAVFEQQQLVFAKTLRAKSPRTLAALVRSTLRSFGDLDMVAEMPRTYDHARAKDDDLESLRELVQALELLGAVRVTYPSEWKGNVPKGVTRKRVLDALRPSERRALHDRAEDTFDAVGLGLWYVGRVGQGVTRKG